MLPRRLSRRADAAWVPNYGTWTEEWAALDARYAARGMLGLLDRGVDARWSDTECFFGEDAEGRVRSEPEGSSRRGLGREYLRVSRSGLEDLFCGSEDNEDIERGFDVVREDVLGAALNTNLYAPAGAVSFEADHTGGGHHGWKHSSTDRNKK